LQFHRVNLVLEVRLSASNFVAPFFDLVRSGQIHKSEQLASHPCLLLGCERRKVVLDVGKKKPLVIELPKLIIWHHRQRIVRGRALIAFLEESRVWEVRVLAFFPDLCFSFPSLFCLLNFILLLPKALGVTGLVSKQVTKELVHKGLSPQNVTVLYHAGMNILGLEDANEVTQLRVRRMTCVGEAL
jgi:hypothetical protein